MISEQRLDRPPQARSLFDPAILGRATIESLKKLDPRWQVKSPVMFVCEIGALVTALYFALDLVRGHGQAGFDFAISIWLWSTVIFASFAEAVAEGRGKAQAEFLRRTKTETTAHLIANGKETLASATQLRVGDIVRVAVNEIIPADGDVIEGVASVDESAITGESAPVIREAGGDRTSRCGGTGNLSDHIVVRISSNPGESFLDRMISLVEGAKRQKTP